MQTDPMFVITKSGLTIRPEGIELSIAHTLSYIGYLGGLLEEFQREAARARTIAPEGIPQEDSIVADTKRELSRAEAHKANLEEARGHIIHNYDRNFQDWAEAFRQARIQLGLKRIEDSPHLEALLKIVMRMLKAENPRFSESKFRSYINREETYMKEKMIFTGKTPDEVILWKCPCEDELPEDADPVEFWPCNENGETQRLTPSYMHQLEWCGCGRIFNCHTGEVVGNLKDKKPISIAPDFTDYDYPEDGGRKLPTYKGYTIDMRLWHFRKTDKPWEFLPFDSEEGDALFAELLVNIQNRVEG